MTPLRIEKMHGNKTDQTSNGQFEKVRKHPWEQYHSVWVPAARCWIQLKKSLSPDEQAERIERFIERAEERARHFRFE